jgi:putative addiction module component (TIGR02574 family)
MPRLTPQAAELLDKALALSSDERGLLIDRLVESMEDEPADAGVEAAWAEEIKRRVDEIRSGKVKKVPGEQVDQWLSDRLRDAKK